VHNSGLILVASVFGIFSNTLRNAILGFLSVINVLGLPLFIWITLAAHVKRWHDLGVTGWAAAPCLLPILNVIALIALGAMPGEPGANKYGVSPPCSLNERNTTGTLFLVFLGVALLVLVLAIVLNVTGGSEAAYILDSRGSVPGEFGYSKVLGVRGGFVWRFFEWHIFGDNVTAIDWFFIDEFGLLPSSLIDVLNPTLFHISSLFLAAAFITRARGTAGAVDAIDASTR
jgi:hypothetical protein